MENFISALFIISISNIITLALVYLIVKNIDINKYFKSEEEKATFTSRNRYKK